MATCSSTTLQGFPTEILDNIFIFIRAEVDQRSVSLVSHRWCDVMTPHMFRYFTTDMCPTSDKEMAALIHPDSRILRHIRNLTVEEESEFSEEDLDLLLAALPRDQLRSFTHEGRKQLSTHTLQLLLQCHRTLNFLCATGVPSIAELKHSSAIIPHLASVRTFSVTVPRETVEGDAIELYFRNAHHIIQNMPEIFSLRFRCGAGNTGSRRRINIAPLFAQGASPLRLSRLKHLSLRSVQMVPNYHALLGSLEILRLKTLYLNNCVNVQSLLDTMTSAFEAEESRGDLRRFILFLDQRGSRSLADVHAVEGFLKACPRLNFLKLGYMDYHKIDTSCIAVHAETLNVLSLATMEGHVYHPGDIQHLLSVCTGLNQLGLNFPQPKLGSTSGFPNTVAFGRPHSHSAHVSNELETLLVRT